MQMKEKVVKTMQSRWLLYMVMVAVILALFVVMLGAYTRLTNAGLGCPDWPGCYGHLVLPNHYPELPLEARKAWTEMAHRYAAGSLALLIFLISIASRLRLSAIKLSSLGERSEAVQGFGVQHGLQRRLLPLALILLVLFQAALGMWTVTMKLLPVVVMGHLLGGILIFSLLCYLGLQIKAVPSERSRWRSFVGLGIVMVLAQIALGGWVSANYAGIACTGFPECNGQWFPTLHFSKGFYLFSPLGTNYQGGVLGSDARVTIAFIHRLGAAITFAYVLFLSIALLLNVTNRALRRVAWLAIFLVCMQCFLGIMNVIYLLPIEVAVAHNGVAAMLMASMLMMFYLTQGRTQDV